MLSSKCCLLAAVLLLASQCAPAAAATVKVQWTADFPKVSGGKGYTTKNESPALTVCVGDTVAFSWPVGPESVVETKAGDSVECFGKVIKTLAKPAAKGAFSLKMAAAGTRYFISGVNDECLFGNRIQIKAIKCAGR